jgi:hypothetical protein
MVVVLYVDGDGCPGSLLIECVSVCSVLGLKASLVAVDEKLFTLSDEDCKGAKAEAANRAAIDAENNLKSKLQALEKVESLGAVAAVISICNDPLGEALDKEKGHTVTDHAVFDAHCRKYEQSFLDDMRALGVQDPDVLTVSHEARLLRIPLFKCCYTYHTLVHGAILAPRVHSSYADTITTSRHAITTSRHAITTRAGSVVSVHK